MTEKFCIFLDLIFSLILLVVREIQGSGEDFLESKTNLYLPRNLSKHMNSLTHFSKSGIISLVSLIQCDFSFFKKLE